ncbi:MAG: S8 family serine peptidase [Clostridia bacterium]|nr:S8 family serine peptidase [Clostridia bacterium]
MKKFISWLLTLSLFALSASSVAASDNSVESAAYDLSEYINNEIFVMYSDGDFETLTCADETELTETLASLSENSDVILYQPNYSYTQTSVTVNDEYYAKQWALNNDGSFYMEEQKNEFPVYDNPFTEPSLPWQWLMPDYFGRPGGRGRTRAFASDNSSTTTVSAVVDVDINAPEAWEIYNGGEREVIVALVDTGIDYTHTELADSIWINEGEIPDNGIDDDGNGYVDDVYGWNFYDNSNVVYTGDDDDHGTHGAGTIAAKADNSAGIAGIVQSDNVKIMSVKALGGSSGSGTTESIIRAIRHAEANGASICNLSLGTSSDDQALYMTLASSDMLFVVAAGNDGANTDEEPCYPASYDLDNIISVANVSYDGNLHYSSNYGSETVDIAAPGTYILSTTTDGSYSYMTGTSMAAPMVTAGAAMLYSHYTDITLADVKEILLSSAKQLDSLSDTTVSGGMLDLYAALTYDHSLLSGATWTKIEYTGSAPQISAYIMSSFGTDYLVVQIIDPDYDLVLARYGEGTLTAEDFDGGNNGTEVTLSSGTATYYAEDGTYTFYALDAEGNEAVQTFTVTTSSKSNGGSTSPRQGRNYTDISNWMNNFFSSFPFFGW